MDGSLFAADAIAAPSTAICRIFKRKYFVFVTHTQHILSICNESNFVFNRPLVLGRLMGTATAAAPIGLCILYIPKIIYILL